MVLGFQPMRAPSASTTALAVEEDFDQRTRMTRSSASEMRGNPADLEEREGFFTGLYLTAVGQVSYTCGKCKCFFRHDRECEHKAYAPPFIIPELTRAVRSACTSADSALTSSASSSHLSRRA